MRATHKSDNDSVIWLIIAGVILAISCLDSALALSPQSMNAEIKLTVTKSDNMIALEGSLARSLRKEGLKAVAVYVLIENNSEESLPVYWGSFKLKDQNHEIAEASLWATGKRPYLNITTVEAGDKIAAWIGFEASIGIVLEDSFIRYDQMPNGYSTNSMISEWFTIRTNK